MFCYLFGLIVLLNVCLAFVCLAFLGSWTSFWAFYGKVHLIKCIEENLSESNFSFHSLLIVRLWMNDFPSFARLYLNIGTKNANKLDHNTNNKTIKNENLIVHSPVGHNVDTKSQ